MRAFNCAPQPTDRCLRPDIRLCHGCPMCPGGRKAVLPRDGGEQIQKQQKREGGWRVRDLCCVAHRYLGLAHERIALISMVHALAMLLIM